jgi:hypothetical protein
LVAPHQPHPDKAACAYDAATWRFWCGRDALNFFEIETREDAEFLAPPPLIQS